MQTLPDRPVPSISTLTASADGHGKGDVKISMDKGLASKIREILASSKTGTCKPGKKRAISLGCITTGGKDLLFNAKPGSGLHDLLLTNGDFPSFKDADTNAAMHEVEEYGRSNAGVLGLDPNAAARVGSLSFGLAYQQLYESHDVSDQNWYAASELDVKASGTAPASSATSGCATTPIICQKNDCKGEVNKKTCEVSTKKGCKCTNEFPMPTAQSYDTSVGNAQASILNDLIKDLASGPTPTPSCFVNSDGPNFTGGAAASPDKWCVCTRSADAIKSVSYATGLYPTIASKTGSDACAYSTMPTSTISISRISPKNTGKPSSCRIVT